MDGCRQAYNEEFEILAQNFENVKNTLDAVTLEKKRLANIIEL